MAKGELAASRNGNEFCYSVTLPFSRHRLLCCFETPFLKHSRHLALEFYTNNVQNLSALDHNINQLNKSDIFLHFIHSCEARKLSTISSTNNRPCTVIGL